jgi:cysteine-rich repeat protein
MKSVNNKSCAWTTLVLVLVLCSYFSFVSALSPADYNLNFDSDLKVSSVIYSDNCDASIVGSDLGEDGYFVSNCLASVKGIYGDQNKEYYKVEVHKKMYSWTNSFESNSDSYETNKGDLISTTNKQVDSTGRVTQKDENIDGQVQTTKYDYSQENEINVEWPDVSGSYKFGEDGFLDEIMIANTYAEVADAQENIDETNIMEETYNEETGELESACFKDWPDICVNYEYNEITGLVSLEKWNWGEIVPIYLPDERKIAEEVYIYAGGGSVSGTGAAVKNFVNGFATFITGHAVFSPSDPGLEYYDAYLYLNPGDESEESYISVKDAKAYGVTVSDNINVNGNGIWEPSNGEQCDDGNTGNGDGCSASGKVEEVPEYSEQFCDDSDGGLNYTEYGGVVDSSESDFFIDHCIDTKTLAEAFCNSSNLGQFANYSCPNGCFNSTCINESGICVSSLNCTVSPSICPASGSQVRTCIEICSGNVTTENIECAPGICSGCQTSNSGCVKFGGRFIDSGAQSYCDIDGQTYQQKADGGSCNNNYECAVNFCSNGKCLNIEKTNEEIGGIKIILMKILCKLSHPFDSASYDECITNSS